MVSSDDLAGDIQANAQSWIGFFLWISDLIEALKNFLVMSLGNANAEILHADDGLFLVS